MSNIGGKRFSGVEFADSGAALDVAFIGGEQGVDPARVRQNQFCKEDGVQYSEYSGDGQMHMPDRNVPTATVNYLGGTMLL